MASISGIILSLATGGGNVGPLQVQVNLLTASLSGAGSLTVTNTGGPLDIGPVSAQTIVITNNDDINVINTVFSLGTVFFEGHNDATGTANSTTNKSGTIVNF